MMNDFDKVSEDIRKAFRLLMVFTKTFYGIVKFIERKLGICFVGDSQIHGKPPTNGSKNLDNKDWWDWFPLYYHIFDFSKNKKYSLSIILQCDTGYWDYYSSNKNTENYFLSNIDDIEAEEYSNVSASKTKIVFAAVNKADVDIGQIFEDSYRDENTIDKNYSFLTKNCQKEFTLPLPRASRSNKKIFFHAYELSDFKDEETTIKTLKNFVAYLKKNGITDFKVEESND